MTEKADQPEPADSTVDAFDEALTILGDETRLEILLVLAEEANEQGMGCGLAFSELRERVGVEDSGRFNYHLDKLSGRFVGKFDGQYVARYPGLALIATMYAGVHRDTDDGDPWTAETEFECPEPDCTRQISVNYGVKPLYSGMWIACPEHGTFDEYPVPPGAQMDRSLHELMEVAYTRFFTNLDLARRGICLQCWGNMSLEYPAELPEQVKIGDRIAVKARCDRCWNQPTVVLGSLFLLHPQVLAPFRARGYDLMEIFEELTTVGESTVGTLETELLDTDPPRASVRVECDDETVELTVDENCTVIETERR